MSKPFKLLFVADLSGRASQDINDHVALAARPIRRIDKDTLDEVFAKFGVKLQFAFDESPVCFDDIDALHPDHLVEHLAIFARYRQLKSQLKKPDGVSFVAEALGLEEAKALPSTDQSPIDGQLLDSVLNESAIGPQAGGAFDVKALIHSAVAPYIVNKPDPRVDTLKTLLDSAMSDTLRGVLHTKAFRQLESAWRAIDFLNRRVDTDRVCHLHVMDASVQELRADIKSASNDITASGLYKQLVDAMAVPGEQRFDAVVLDYPLQANEADMALLSGLGKIAAEANIALLLNGSEQLAGCESLANDDDPNTWEDPRSEAFNEQLAATRSGLFSRVYVAAPRFLQRLPYGKRSSPIDAFDFEELSSLGAHHDHLWGGGATLLAYLMIQNFAQTGVRAELGEDRYVDNLPVHIATDEDGDSAPLPCAEVVLTDKAVDALADQGLCVLRSVKHQNRVQLSRVVAFSAAS